MQLPCSFEIWLDHSLFSNWNQWQQKKQTCTCLRKRVHPAWLYQALKWGSFRKYLVFRCYFFYGDSFTFKLESLLSFMLPQYTTFVLLLVYICIVPITAGINFIHFCFSFCPGFATKDHSWLPACALSSDLWVGSLQMGSISTNSWVTQLGNSIYP